MTRDEICALIPHRPPFLFVDRILEVEPGKDILGVWEVRADLPPLAGHFPGHPMLPGVLLTEALAQVALVLISLDERNRDRLFLLGSVNKMQFLRPVLPDADVHLSARIERVMGTALVVRASARVEGATVARGELLIGSVARPVQEK